MSDMLAFATMMLGAVAQVCAVGAANDPGPMDIGAMIQPLAEEFQQGRLADSVRSRAGDCGEAGGAVQTPESFASGQGAGPLG
mgnify:CR=1 FL=1